MYHLQSESPTVTFSLPKSWYHFIQRKTFFFKKSFGEIILKFSVIYLDCFNPSLKAVPDLPYAAEKIS